MLSFGKDLPKVVPLMVLSVLIGWVVLGIAENVFRVLLPDDVRLLLVGAVGLIETILSWMANFAQASGLNYRNLVLSHNLPQKVSHGLRQERGTSRKKIRLTLFNLEIETDDDNKNDRLT